MTLDQSRRSFLSRGAAAAGAAMIGVSLPQFLAACKDAGDTRARGADFNVLSPGQASELEAIASCIVPTTDTPGAREAGAVYFIDVILSDRRPDLLDPIQAGLEGLSARARAATAGANSFADLDEGTQVELLTKIEGTDFFRTVRLLTLAGMLADPSYGGNRDRIGWALIGFDGHFAHVPPFGYYDENYPERVSNG